jgi:hypothetical protein
MAQGDIVVFAQFKLDVGLEIHQLETDTIKLGLVTNVVTPTETTSDPRWGSGGSTNLATNQVTPGGNYSSGGPAIANNTYTLNSATTTFDGDDISILQDASNPTNARWGIIYNDTAAGKQAIGFLDLGGDTDLTAGDFSVTFNASGIFTLT